MNKQNCQALLTCRCFKIKLQELTLHLITEAESILHLTFLESHHILASKKLTEAVTLRTTTDKEAPPGWLLRPIEQYMKGIITTLPFQVNSYFLERGTPFQKKVWQQLSEIPPGTTKTYGEIARLIDNPGASRAVGRACHVNPLALIIPCHRVVGQKDAGGFAGGADTKKLLLERENGQSSVGG